MGILRDVNNKKKPVTPAFFCVYDALFIKLINNILYVLFILAFAY